MFLKVSVVESANFFWNEWKESDYAIYGWRTKIESRDGK